MSTVSHDTSPARQAWRAIRPLLLMGALGLAAAWAWRQPFLETPRMLWRISRMAPASALPSPVDGVGDIRVGELAGEGRGLDARGPWQGR